MKTQDVYKGQKMHKGSAYPPYRTTYHRYEDANMVGDCLKFNISTLGGYLALEAMIDQLTDFAIEIREHEPTWKRNG